MLQAHNIIVFCIASEHGHECSTMGFRDHIFKFQYQTCCSLSLIRDRSRETREGANTCGYTSGHSIPNSVMSID